MKRRQFLKTASGAVALAMSPWLGKSVFAEGEKSFKGNEIVELGQTGIRVSRLAQGTGTGGSRRSSRFTRMGKEAFDDLLQYSLKQGITFIDMADSYGTHTFVKESIKQVSREKLALLSKIWAYKEPWNTPSGGAKKELDRFRSELRVDMIDVCLIHCMVSENWTTEFERVRDELSELKEKGIVRAVGVSCHYFGALEVAAEHPWVDVIMARINHKGGRRYFCDDSLENVTAVLKKARQNGKAIIGMKIFANGRLVQPNEKDESLSYVFKNDLVDAVSIGMCSKEEIDDTMMRMAKI
ncbi:aldo/keto reductase [candidate division KSB1 bacterium]|nr:aldo/keto reductase [candidate division KSB1 bacterium]